MRIIKPFNEWSPFWHGFAGVFDLGGALWPPEAVSGPFKAKQAYSDAIAADWRVIGETMASAFGALPAAASGKSTMLPTEEEVEFAEVLSDAFGGCRVEDAE